MKDRFEKSQFSPSTAGFQELRYSAHLDKLWCRTSQSPLGLPAGKLSEFSFPEQKINDELQNATFKDSQVTLT